MRKILFLVVVLVILLAIWFLVSPYNETFTGQAVLNIPALSTSGYELAEVFVSGQVIHLRSGCKSISIITTKEQVDSIKRGLGGKTFLRPDTHELIRDITEMLGGQAVMVKIESLREGTYYAKLVIVQGNKILNLDSRPSDAIATASKLSVPVYVKKELLETRGEKVC